MNEYFLRAIRDPQKLGQVLTEMGARFQAAQDTAKKKSPADKNAK
jgi:hypothetical protein